MYTETNLEFAYLTDSVEMASDAQVSAHRSHFKTLVIFYYLDYFATLASYKFLIGIHLEFFHQ